MEINFADLDKSLEKTPPELVGVYPLGGGGLIEAPYRHYFELKHLQKIIPFNKDMNVLELGCGNGRWAVSLAPLVRHYTGIDLTHEALEIAKKVTSKKGISNVSFHLQSIVDFEGDRCYDVVYFASVSQYLTDKQVARVLQNLSKHLKPDTIFVDRSSVNLIEREILSRPNYFSILRPPKELEHIYQKIGYSLIYHKRSYRFLRAGRILLRYKYNNWLYKFILATSPVSLYLMYFFTLIADKIKPIQFEGGNISHDFMLFKRKEI